MLKDAGNKLFPAGAVIWFEDMDRFGRGELLAVLADWSVITQQGGYSIHIESIGQTFDRKTDQMQLMGVILKAILAHDESKKKARRTRDNWERRRNSIAEGGILTSKIPTWLKITNGKPDRDNAKAVIVRNIFTMPYTSASCWCRPQM